MNQYMNEALKEAYLGIDHGHGGPFGAVIVKNGNFIIPGGGDVIEEGDSVVVVTTDTALTSLSQIVRKGGVKK